MQYCEDTISTKPVTICRTEANKTCYQEKKKNQNDWDSKFYFQSSLWLIENNRKY